MELRDFGKRSGLKVAPVSIGAMRLPTEDNQGQELLQYAIDAGMRYIDTSSHYLGQKSQVIVGEAVKGEYRDRVIVSNKAGRRRYPDDWTAEDFVGQIKYQMGEMDLDYLDFFQAWGMSNMDQWEQINQPDDMVDGIRMAMDEGLIGHTGFTTHMNAEDLVNKVLPEADWVEIILISYNMLNRSSEPALAKMHELDIGTIVMNPVGGGKLAEDSPVLMEIAEEVGAVSVADLAIRYVLANPNVDTIACGMRKKQDVDDSVASAERGPLTAEQVETVNEAMADLARDNVDFCTACGYCMPCPQEIKIPKLMGAIYEDRFLGLEKAARNAYNRGPDDEPKADACVQCGQCEDKCPNNLPIMQELAAAHEKYVK